MFDPQYADRIFEVFQRLHGRNTYEGTAIGLSICKQVVDNHNGIIYASGQVGVGSSFTILLPMAGTSQ
ncbi:ATP-binding protein [Dyadobacter koreensis]|uniref:ATP-binding protein n=1 Tax=Dyadobacter koreensis TaxID=408657 RepID=UPI00286D76BF|nr:ATP-binding protein [Dyadobacter koreensis]